MTYIDLLYHLAEVYPDLCPEYISKHLSVKECFNDAEESEQWSDTIRPEVYKSVLKELISFIQEA